MPQSNVAILKKPKIKSTGVRSFLFSKNTEKSISENIIGISLATR